MVMEIRYQEICVQPVHIGPNHVLVQIRVWVIRHTLKLLRVCLIPSALCTGFK